ncbi:tetratricopeptide repeat protein [Pseudoxanthomonas sp. PXM01]|uniref:tetratricopeptide repeat protein n=1 Tax=Pseudoxanthomonas sp. PXM01 TaxID=2769295 RepID=UPI00177C5E35|nr:tetratricopeptide repeat protein [Pseudoxanthomonas sp. PXM01]MBD9471114.1 tetratricopeptide repeat protein [Pseudoxanthomonas sp. PXM01]
MKAWMWTACLLAASQGLCAQSAAPVDGHDAHHQQPPAAISLGKTGPSLHEKRKQGVAPAYARQWRDAMALGDNGDAADADRALATVMARPEFAVLSADEQRATWSRAGWMAIATGNMEHARTLLRQALEAGSDNLDDYYLLAQVEAELGHADAAAHSLTQLAERWPQRLDDLDPAAIFGIAHKAPQAHGVERRLLEALFASGWTNRGLGVGELWYQLASLRLAAGDTQGIAEAIRRSDAPEALVSFLTDRRFDAWIDRQAPGMDVAYVAHQRVARLEDLVERRPDLLEARMELGYALMSVGRHEDVIALSDQTQAEMHAASSGAAVFVDMQYTVWILDNRASALARLGRWDEAITQLRQAAKMEEQGQSINLARLLCNLGRTREAADALVLPARPTPDGKRHAAAVRHCIAVQEGDRAAARKAFADIRRYRNDSTVSWINALLRAGRQEEAARVLRNALRDGEHWSAALASLQTYRRRAPLPAEQVVIDGWHALAQRKDVQRAVDKAGRIEAFDIYEPYSD